ncbi:RND family efflux transporter MFP subunit [Methylorubrum rhodinum]|uniref:RND family efflux transporter MFP subunit n=1 Tax=Methylorubrum rhodinum TaxID=29428 RepID=A0A840ZHI8_9HYPH|nr:efflux RND transporter periplasmic adaptor subunit [Methylorubrum rhodinum]MBB5757329.1 RND family efflux transporter MFP subunit [Methylorubrum rhodinum]
MRIARSVALALALALAGGSAAGWLRATRAEEAPAGKPETVQAVETEAVSTEPVARTVTAAASLRAVRQVMLSAEVGGRVTAIRFEGGGRVAAGAPLVELFADPQRAELERYRADETLARLQLDRGSELLQRAATAQAEVDKRRAGLDQARALREGAEAALAQRTVRAPFAGELGLRRTDLGHTLKPGDPIATLTDLDALYVDFALPQRHLADLRVGQAVEVESDAAGGRRFTARIETIDPQIDPTTRNIALRARLDNREALLRPGAAASATLGFAPEVGGLSVPETAIVASAASDTAFVVRDIDAAGRGRAEQVAVTTGRRRDGRVAVTGGLRAGETVVTAGQIRLSPGAAVRVDPSVRPVATASVGAGPR